MNAMSCVACRSGRCSTCNLGVTAARSARYYNRDVTSFHATEAGTLSGSEGMKPLKSSASGI